ncbi:sperm-associated antigen 1-like [Diabrotica virgifera virgifera]|uniref:Sperm-associated antigen 1-like n=1 Tax=Diabrotica virgifera virgifera TaxID=50390 RepID=A0A6P7H3H7_DIAVI|nr:sperm-associated antigen 1-like [Diabrotica virgifera virgifera]
MSSVDDLSKLPDNFSGIEKGESLLSKFNIPITHFEFDHVEKCTDGRELERIVQVLRSGEEGWYPDLLKCAEERLRIVKPRSKYLREACPVLEKRDLTKDDLDEIAKDLGKFLIVADKTNRELEQRKLKSVDHDIEVRKCIKEFSEKQPLNEKRIASTDYKSWDKYDPDTEILKMDLEEERKKQEVLANEETHKNRKTKKCVRFNKFATEAEAIFFSEREREKGNECFKVGGYEEALEFYTRSIGSKATVENLNNRAVTYLKLKRYREAVDDCDKVLTFEKGNIKAHTRKAEALDKLGKYKEALDNAEFVIYKEPNNKYVQELTDRIRNKCFKELKKTRMKIIEID